MSFVHEDKDFGALVDATARSQKISPGLVEKDYWVTHTLWVLQQSGLEVWFKGGTSLSKGFGLIQRFSEDLDLKLDPGSLTGLPKVPSWKSESTKAGQSRQAYWTSLVGVLRAKGLDAGLDPDLVDERWMSANVRVNYPGQHLTTLPGVMKQFVLLELGDARVTPFIERDMTSFVHEELKAQSLLTDYDANQPLAVRCVHPLVTLLEKLDAIQKRADQGKAAASFVRHYEDAAQIIQAQKALPPLPDYESTAALAAEMVAQKQLRRGLPSAGSEVFNLFPAERT